MSLVEGIEHLDRVEHSGFVGMRELLDEGLDRRGVGQVGADGARRNRPRSDAVAKRAAVLAPGHEHDAHPDAGHPQAGVTQRTPIEPESPRFDEGEEQDRSQCFREAIGGDVDERLRAVFEFQGHRQEQHLASGLVYGVAKRGLENAGELWRPQRPRHEHDDRRRAHGQRQQEHREGQTH